MERLQNRELELMKYEDLLSKQYQEEYCHMVVHKSELSRDTKNLLIQCIFNCLYTIFIYNYPRISFTFKRSKSK